MICLMKYIDGRLWRNCSVSRSPRDPLKMVERRKERYSESFPVTNPTYEKGFVMYPESFYSPEYLKKQYYADWQHVPHVLRCFSGMLWQSLKKDGIPIYAEDAFNGLLPTSDPARWGHVVSFRHHKLNSLSGEAVRFINLKARDIYNRIPNDVGRIRPFGPPLTYRLYEKEYIHGRPPKPGKPERYTLGYLLKNSTNIR